MEPLSKLSAMDRWRRHFEMPTGRIEQERSRGEPFAIVRDLDKLAKPKVQAHLRRAGRTAEITITVLSGGEDRLRGVVGWFGRKCEHRLDWFHVSPRLERTRKQLFQLPSSPVYGCRLAFHSRNLNRIKRQLWNSGIERRTGECESSARAWLRMLGDSPKFLRRYQSVELQLDELRSYLYANANAMQGYAKAFRKGRRASTAHVESTVNQLINWRFYKKQQMSQTEQARKPCCMSRQQLSTERLPDTQAGSASALSGIRPHLFFRSRFKCR